MDQVLVRLKRVNKHFPGTHALKNVDLEILRGEIHGLVGENGAGKSTLIKILTGAYLKDSGELFIDGHPANILGPAQAESYGINAVYQDVMLCPHLTVAENILLGREPSRAGIIQRHLMHQSVRTLLEDLGFDVREDEPVWNLPLARQQLVAIAKAVSRHSRLLIFDEPTAFLSDQEAQRLFSIIRDLNARGMTILYISHRLEEVFDLCHRVTVLRDGERVGTYSVAELDVDRVVTMMVGRHVQDLFYKEPIPIGETVLKVEHLNTARLRDISFELHRGEIIGIFGLVGSGRTDLLKALFGVEPIRDGRVLLRGIPIRPRSPAEAIRLGMALIPESRRTEGLCLQLPVLHNINLPIYGEISGGGLVNPREERRRAERFIEYLSIRTPSAHQTVANLSGGNQQKVVVAKWLNRNSSVYFFDEPTTGIDVGAKAEIYRLFAELLRRGAAIVIVSSYLPEVLALSDRILVIRDGRLALAGSRNEVTPEQVLRSALGSERS